MSECKCKCKQLSDQQYTQTNRRRAAVETLLSLGFTWNGRKWITPVTKPSPNYDDGGQAYVY